MSGFDLGGAINACADWACGAPIIRGIVSNAVFTALLITALVVVVVMALYRYQIKQAGAKKGARAVLYVLFLVTAVMFVHHYAVMRIARDSAAQKGVRDVFSSIQQSRESGVAGGTPVIPWGEPAAAATGVTTGGSCGCPAVAGTAPAAGSRQPQRPDNVASGSDLVIEDVVVPATVSPFSG